MCPIHGPNENEVAQAMATLQRAGLNVQAPTPFKIKPENESMYKPLTAEQKAIAKQMHVNEDEYRVQHNRIGALEASRMAYQASKQSSRRA